MKISCSQIRSGKRVVLCVVSGCVEVCIVVCWMRLSLGVFLWGVLRHSLCVTLGTRGAAEKNTVCIS